MNKTVILLTTAWLAGIGSVASASTISFVAPPTVSGPFDVVVRAQNLFTGRDIATDLIISYGFNVNVSNPAILSFLGATSGPQFDAATTEPGTDVFAAAFGQHGFGIEPGLAEPLTLVTLHFNATGSGPATIFITSDLSNPFQGLQFVNEPFQEPIAGTIAETIAASPVPEPATILLTGVGVLAAARRRRRVAN
jgi:hypothetical protein